MSFMPKIAVVIPKYNLIGGAEQFAAELTGKLCSRHQETFQVFANRWQSNSGSIPLHKIPIISFPKFLTAISFAYFAQRQLRRSNFPLVHSHGILPLHKASQNTREMVAIKHQDMYTDILIEENKEGQQRQC